MNHDFILYAYFLFRTISSKQGNEAAVHTDEDDREVNIIVVYSLIQQIRVSSGLNMPDGQVKNT